MTSAVAENILSSMSDHLKLPSTEDGGLPCKITGASLLANWNFILIVVNVRNKLKVPHNASSFEMYYTRSNENWANLVP